MEKSQESYHFPSMMNKLKKLQFDLESRPLQIRTYLDELENFSILDIDSPEVGIQVTWSPTFGYKLTTEMNEIVEQYQSDAAIYFRIVALMEPDEISPIQRNNHRTAARNPLRGLLANLYNA